MQLHRRQLLGLVAMAGGAVVSAADGSGDAQRHTGKEYVYIVSSTTKVLEIPTPVFVPVVMCWPWGFGGDWPTPCNAGKEAEWSGARGWQGPAPPSEAEDDRNVQGQLLAALLGPKSKEKEMAEIGAKEVAATGARGNLDDGDGHGEEEVEGPLPDGDVRVLEERGRDRGLV